MARPMEEIQKDYGQAAAQLGDLAYKKRLTEDNLEDVEYQMQRLLNKMQSLAKEAKSIAEASEPVPLPEVKEEPKNEEGT